MADLERKRRSAQDKLAEALHVLASFLDAHAKAHPEAHAKTQTRQTTAPALWPWRKTVGFVLVAGLAGWSAILGLIYLLSRL